MSDCFFKKRTYILLCGLLFAILCVFGISCNNVSAIKTIPKSKYEKGAVFENKHYMTQGGAITEDYYAFVDCGLTNDQQKHGGNTRHCEKSANSVLRVVDRKTCSETSSAKITSGYLSGVYYQWGSKKLTLFGNKQACMAIDNGLAIKSSGCKKATRVDIGISTGQGASAYFNGYYYSVEGITKEKHPIGVFKKDGKKKKKVGVWQLEERIGEPEQISIDGNTGEVYIVYNHGHRQSNSKGKITEVSKTIFIKIDSSVFKEYTGLNGKSGDPNCKGVDKPKGGGDGTDGDNGNGSGNSGSNDSSQDELDKTPEIDIAPSTDYQCASILSFWCKDAETDGNQTMVDIVKFVISTMTIGITILGTVGIIFCGYLVLTAKDNEAQVAKAKKRMIEIIIGILAWVLASAVLSLLLPASTEVDDAIDAVQIEKPVNLS